MKIFIQIMAAMFLFLVPTAGSQAFQNEPNGFRDLYWGESLQEIQQNRKCEYASYRPNLNAVMYKVTLRNDEDTIVSGYPISNEIGIVLWNNQLTAIGIYFNSATYSEMNQVYDGLRNAVILKFGEPSTSNDNKTLWMGTKAYISITKNTNEFNGVFHGVYMVLGSQNLMHQSLQDGASKGW